MCEAPSGRPSRRHRGREQAPDADQRDARAPIHPRGRRASNILCPVSARAFMNAGRITASARVPHSAVGTPSSQRIAAMSPWRRILLLRGESTYIRGGGAGAGERVCTGMQRREVEKRYALGQVYQVTNAHV
jgi:hypothetical protein